MMVQKTLLGLLYQVTSSSAGKASARFEKVGSNGGGLNAGTASRKHFCGSLENHQLQTVAAACGYDLTDHHHALADAEACAWIARKML